MAEYNKREALRGEAAMYVLEYKSLYIPREELTKNRTFQGYRWKQYAMCEERGPLEQIRAAQKRPEEWRIIPPAGSMEQEGGQ